MLDAEQIARLPREQQEQYRVLDQLFLHPGWDLLEKYLQEKVDQAKAEVLYSASWDYNRLSYGKLQAYEDLLAYKQSKFAEFAQQSADIAMMRDLQDESRYE